MTRKMASRRMRANRKRRMRDGIIGYAGASPPKPRYNMPRSELFIIDCTIDELISVCISRQIRDGEMVAQGIATPLVMAGYLLAKCTHAPGVLFCSAIGQGLVQDWAPLGVARIETLWLDKAMLQVGFARAATEVLPRFKPLEFFRPA